MMVHCPYTLDLTALGNITYAPRSVSFYPGNAGLRSFVRFYAPSTQCWKFDYSFWGMDPHPTTSDVVIALEGTLFHVFCSSQKMEQFFTQL